MYVYGVWRRVKYFLTWGAIVHASGIFNEGKWNSSKQSSIVRENTILLCQGERKNFAFDLRQNISAILACKRWKRRGRNKVNFYEKWWMKLYWVSRPLFQNFPHFLMTFTTYRSSKWLQNYIVYGFHCEYFHQLYLLKVHTFSYCDIHLIRHWEFVDRPCRFSYSVQDAGIS